MRRGAIRGRPAAVCLAAGVLAGGVVPAPAQTSPRAHYADGQVWIVWNLVATNLPETFGIYSAPQAFSNVAQATLVGRPFPAESAGSILKAEVQVTYGAPLLTGFRIPTPGGGSYLLATTQGVFAATARFPGSAYFAVVPFGQTNIAASELTTNAVSFTFSTNDPPRPHLQIRTNSTSGHMTSFFALWVDGDQDEEAGRPDFPVLANEAKRGAPHTFMIVEPYGGLPGGGPWPATVCLHGGNGNARDWLPTNDGARAIGAIPTDGVIVAFDDDLYRVALGTNEAHISTGHMGYAREHDPFANALLPPGSTIVNYTQRRYVFVLDWLAANLNVDPRRISLLGHSNGAQGAMMLARVFPDRFSAVSLYNCSMSLFDDVAFVLLFGTEADNFATSVTNEAGLAVRMPELAVFTNRIGPLRDLPFMRNYAGKCDKKNQRQWRPELLDQMRWSDRAGTGLHFFWDLKSHDFEVWRDHWVDVTSSNTLALQTQRDDAGRLSRHRSDQSYPAFFNLQNYAGHGDPGGGAPGGTSSLCPSCCPNPTNGNDHGTWGGYFDWQTNLVDTATNWSCTLFLAGTNSGYADVDISPETNLTADVGIRRPQHFKPDPGRAYVWTVTATNSPVVLQAGVGIVGADGRVYADGVQVPRDPQRIRLNVALAPSLTIAPATPTNHLVGAWIATGFQYQIQGSVNLSNWVNLTPFVPGNDTRTNVTAPYVTNSGFYRLRITP